MPEERKIRPYERADFAACLEIFLSNVPVYFAESEIAEYRDYLKNFASGSYWVVDCEGNVVAAGGISKRESNIGSLCYGMVQAGYHGKGLGSHMLSFRLKQLIDDPDITTIRLETSQHTQEFFKKYGFRRTHIQKSFFSDDLDCHSMELKIPEQQEQRLILKDALF